MSALPESKNFQVSDADGFVRERIRKLMTWRSASLSEVVRRAVDADFRSELAQRQALGLPTEVEAEPAA